jgi:hypothetical protein
VLVRYALSTSGPGSLTDTYIGNEAGYTNHVSFSISGQSCGDTTDGGLLSFRFSSSGSAATVYNGQNFSNSAPVVFGLIQFFREPVCSSPSARLLIRKKDR